MSRFYWRIFLAFLAVLAITTLISAGASAIWFQSAVETSRSDSLRATLSAVSEQAQRALDSEGEAGLRRWLEGQQADLPIPLLVVGPDGRDLLERPLPPGSQRLLERLAGQDRAGPMGNFRRGPLRRLRAADGRAYLLLIPPRERFSGGRFQQPELRGLFFIVLLAVSALACLWLARYLVRPVRVLRAAGQAIAAGDLAARAGPAMRARGDEFGALARDFDRMADRVQQLLENQQRLLRDVSHELRSPLARLQAAAGLLRQRARDEDVANLERIDQEVVNLDRLIGLVLGYVRLDAIDRIVTEPVDLAELLAGIVTDAAFEGRGRGCSVSLDGEGPLLIEADGQLLASALENVVRNGLQHAQSRVQVHVEALGSNRVKVVVSDDGPGVPDEELVRIFVPFHAGAGGGAGIGLAIAKRAIGLHGGTIEAANGAQQGLVVTIELPVNPA